MKIKKVYNNTYIRGSSIQYKEGNQRKYGYYLLGKGKIDQEILIITIYYATNKGPENFIKLLLTNLIKHIDGIKIVV